MAVTLPAGGETSVVRVSRSVVHRERSTIAQGWWEHPDETGEQHLGSASLALHSYPHLHRIQHPSHHPLLHLSPVSQEVVSTKQGKATPCYNTLHHCSTIIRHATTSLNDTEQLRGDSSGKCPFCACYFCFSDFWLCLCVSICRSVCLSITLLYF